MTEKPCIYKIKNLVTGKVYIGKTKNLKMRLIGHRSSKKTTPLSKSIQKHGWDKFEWEVLQEFDVEPANIFDIEAEWIEKFDATNREFGYNCLERSVGPSNYKHTEEAKRKISEASKKPRKKVYKRSKEANEAFSIAARKRNKERREKGIDHPNQNRVAPLSEVEKNSNPIVQIDLVTGEILRRWLNATEVQRELGINACAIGRVCRKERGNVTAGGFKWDFEGGIQKLFKPHITAKGKKFSDEEWTQRNQNVKKTHKFAPRAIIQMDETTGEVIKEWRSCNYAATTLGFPMSSLNKAAKKEKSLLGFKWKFADRTNDTTESPLQNSAEDPPPSQ